MIVDETSNPTIFVIFGIPGAGKTTIAKYVVQEMLTKNSALDGICLDRTRQRKILHLDLDDCVPAWMRTNFAQGIYPTLEQRHEFAASCCTYVNESIQKKVSSSHYERRQQEQMIVLVSFSFVNEDLRRNFRQHFPNSYWILIDTCEEEAQRRIRLRAHHFYKGKPHTDSMSNHGKPNSAVNDNDNNEWKFSPVIFPHAVVNGHKAIEVTSSEIVTLIERVLHPATS
jgi:adenylate kinase family enzyme